MFDNQFEVVLADTLESKRIHYAIRYQVYCEETGFEKSDDFPSMQEYDDYDGHSIHFIARHKPTGQWIGALRLIVKKDCLLPIERHCALDKSIGINETGRSVELSRLCLINKIRRKFNDSNLSYDLMEDQGDVPKPDNIRVLNNCRVNRSIIWGLIYAASAYSFQNNIRNWYFMTTHGLEKILRKGGLEIINIGNPCNYKGRRYPFEMDAFDTYRSAIWRDEPQSGYRLFSELNRMEKHKAA